MGYFEYIHIVMVDLIFDVMVGERFYKTLRYRHSGTFPLKEEELRDFVLAKLPTLKNKNFTIAI